MEKVFLDKYTRDAAIDYANNEAELRGFERGGVKWKNCFRDYLVSAYSTMSVGRNPRGEKNPTTPALRKLYPDVFENYASQVSKNYEFKGTRGTTVEVIRSLITSAMSTLSNLSLSGLMDVSVKAKKKIPGKMPNADMSDIQFKNSEDLTNEEKQAEDVDILYFLLMRDLLNDCVIECLSPFFRLSKNDVEEILSAVKFEDVHSVPEMTKVREKFLKEIRSRVKPAFDAINFRKIILGR